MSLGDENHLGIRPSAAEDNNLDSEWRAVMNRVKTELEQKDAAGYDSELTFEVSSSRSSGSSQSILGSRPDDASPEARFVRFGHGRKVTLRVN